MNLIYNVVVDTPILCLSFCHTCRVWWNAGEVGESKCFYGLN